MYPFFDINWFLIYTFWLSLMISFFAFFWMLNKLGTKNSIDTRIFSHNIIWYFLSVFFFSRLFYVIARWSDLKFIENPMQFFIMSDYNFSLFWALLWFFIVLSINLSLKKEKVEKYVDSLVLSFLFILSIGFIWALLWGQVYWVSTDFWIEISYNHPFSLAPSGELFPLPAIYAISFFLLFSALYILSMFIKIRWFIGYLGLLLFSAIVIIFENFSWKFDIVSDNIEYLNMNQLLAIFLVFYSLYKLYIVSKIASKDTTVVIDKNDLL